MKRNGELDELIEHFTILPNEMKLVEPKSAENQLGFAVLLKFFQHEARFPTHPVEVPKPVIAYLAKQIVCEPDRYVQYDWNGRTIKAHRVQIREFFEFREVKPGGRGMAWPAGAAPKSRMGDREGCGVPPVSGAQSRAPDPRPCGTSHALRAPHLRKAVLSSDVPEVARVHAGQDRCLD